MLPPPATGSLIYKQNPSCKPKLGPYVLATSRQGAARMGLQQHFIRAEPSPLARIAAALAVLAAGGSRPAALTASTAPD